ncbi:hypothetical protein [Streptomyces sp. NPDC008001]|uniref:hypothetical protein n=1 Tax=Streptomyces sp. NPDC008001 TaxID=3364804 RepID=UPI0036ED8DB7
MTQPAAAGATPRFSVHFHDNHTATPAGFYTVTLDHLVSGEKVGSDQLPAAGQTFEIRAPQFTLDGTFVHAVHPAPAASGAFEYVLPHITLNRLILPWERALDAAVPELPWLALLLFAEGELPDDPKAQGHTRTRTVRELLTATDALVPDITLEAEVPPELHDSTCTTLDVPSDVFAALVPRRADLPHLCHVRKVSDRQAARVRRAGEELEAGDYAVVVANRFPRTAGRYAAHLVSLEGFADHLDGSRPDPSVVRMVSLHAWSFEARPDANAHFATLIQRMADDPGGLGLRLRPQPARTTTPTAATRRLDLGHVPVDHVLPSGEHTVAWYRGPFTPVVAPAVPKPASGHWTSADEALVYLTDTGVFDVSYAAAFTLGRTLALSDASLAAAVSAFRGRARRIAQRTLLRSRTQAHPAHDRFHELIENGLGARIHTAATTPSRARTGPAPAPRRHTGGVPRPPALTDLHTRLRTTATRDVLRSALSEPLAPLMTVLDQVTLLAAAPLGHLVPDARMLPPESLRFFHVDPQWCEALRDGVLSTGLGTSLDAAVNDLAREALEPPRPLSGLLMRSALVKGWPDVVIEPRRTGTGGTPELMDIVHRTITGPDLLLCLVDGVPDQAVFREPYEGVHFGVDTLDGTDRINLRRPTDPVGESLDQWFPPEGEEGISRFLRTATGTGTPEVLDVADGGTRSLVDGLATALRAAGHLGPGEELSPSVLAVELVNAPHRITFAPQQAGRQ